MPSSAKTKLYTQWLEVHGTAVCVKAFQKEVIEDLRHDFAYFLTEKLNPKQNTFVLTSHPKDEAKAHSWIPVFRFRDSTIYASLLWERRVKLFGKAFIRYGYRQSYAHLYGDEPALNYECVYLILLSYLGEKLGREGFQRIHGLGFDWQGNGVLVLAKSGGGKSTLAMELLKEKPMHLLSDDTPFLTPSGEMIAFPQRIALKKRPEIEGRYLRNFKRVKHGEKYVVGADYFHQKIMARTSLNWILVLEKKRAKQARLVPLKKYRAYWPLLKWLVIGYETPQVWQLFVRVTPREVGAKIKLVGKRLQMASAMLRRGRFASLTLSEDVADGKSTLLNFFEREGM